MKKIILSLMAVAGMQSVIAGQEKLTVNFSGEVVHACEISSGNNPVVDFGEIPSGEVAAERFSFNLICTEGASAKIYPVNQYTYFYGDETLKFSIFDELTYRANTHFDDGLQQSDPWLEKVWFSGMDVNLVVAVQGEGDEYSVPVGSGSRNIGKTLIKPQNFNVVIPMVIEFDAVLN